jgi:predicted signal transduction protein with EAL and GGDEF domain
LVGACVVGDRAESEQLASALIGDLSRPFRIDGHRIACGASMGVALLPDDGPNLDTAVQSADLALYHAKVGGRNQLRFFDPAMTRDLVRKKEIESELRAAIRKDELSIFFQPIVDLKTGRIRTFEALVRWFHPEKGELRPDEFIPVAEETGVIITLSNWIATQAARAAAQWPEHVTLAVNLSPIQLRAPGAALGILTALRDAGLPPSRLELEVTESLFIEESEHTARFMEELAAEGVCFALDDFGTGYSSLGYINQFPFKKIKVDRSFVSGPNIGRKSDAIIRAVAEETGVIITLGNWITSQAAKAAAQWPAEVTLAVNLSPIQLRAPGAALGILNALRDAGLPPKRLELEVTESLFIEESEHTAQFMEELAAEGVRFALDDFGTGYSSLGYINQFPFKKIKVDRSFVSGPNIGRKSDAIIRAVAEMGSTLEMEIVAEGLETIEQVETVRNAGCTLGQGYYFSRAVPDFLAAMLLAQEREGRDTVTRLAS